MRLRLLLRLLKEKLRTVKYRKHLTTIILLALSIYTLYTGIIAINKSNTYVSDEIYYVTAAKNIGIKVFGINVTKTPYPEYKGLNLKENLNLEHPPLAKYIIFISMLILGDTYFSWRIPGVVLHTLMIFLVFLTVKKLGDEVSAIVSSFIVAFDPILRNLSYIAMLDIYVAFFLTASFTALIYGRKTLAFILYGLALASKYTALFALPVFLIILRSYHNEKMWKIPLYVLLAGIVYAAAWIPFITYFANEKGILYYGFQRVYEEHVFAMKWHLSSKGGHSYSSPPWGWLFNSKVWPIYGGMSVHSNIYMNIVFAILPLMYGLFSRKIDSRRFYPYYWFLSVIAGFILIYELGSTTQFIFYAATYEPSIAIGVGTLLFPSIDGLSEKISEWRHRGRRGQSHSQVCM